MLNALQSYQYEEIPTRVVMIADEPWWVASDLAKLLGYKSGSDMVRMLDDEERGTHIVQPLYSGNTPLGGHQEMTIVSEPGMWMCIARSRRPEAIKIRKWMFGEVMPSIRRTGRYEVPGLVEAQREVAIASDYDPTRLTASVGVVREARRLYGPAAARRIWVELGLPQAIAGSAADLEGDELAGPLREWLGCQDAVTVTEAIHALDLPNDADITTRRRIGALLRLFGWSSRKVRRGHGTVNLFTREG